jgi:LmbE family N-acetylglucosaminyl deacetylase/chitodextrinase
MESIVRSVFKETHAAFLYVAICVAWLCAATASASVLVIAPHPDDDIISSAGVIQRAAGHDEVTVVYMTNGDANGLSQGYLRQGEAVTAQLKYLGTVEDNLLFLGYPNGHLKEIYDSYTSTSSQYFTPFGQGVTYGNRGLGRKDYHSFRFGSAAAYNRPNIVTDLATILSTYRPSNIYVTSEFERHTDHAATYQLLQLALTQVHAADPSYAPVVNKTIIWTPLPSPWPTTSDPVGFHTPTTYLSETTLVWQDRASLDVPLQMQATDLFANLKYKAIQAHASEFDKYDGFIPKWAHKDEIFWSENPFASNRPPIAEAGADVFGSPGAYAELDGSGSRDPEGASLSYRWTQRAGTPVTLQNSSAANPGFVVPGTAMPSDSWAFQLVVGDGTSDSAADMVNVFAGTQFWNLAPSATVTASSQNTNSTQLATKAVDGIADGHPGDYRREWATVDEKAGAWIRLAWGSARTVGRVVLYDRPNLDDQVLGGLLSFSDGSSINVGALTNGGAPVEFKFPPRSVTSITFTVTATSATTTDVGLSEIRVYGSWPTGGDTTAPSAPSGLTVTAAGENEISLSWTASTGTADVAGYWVYRDGALAGTSTTTSFTDSGLVPGTLYTYTVTAFDGADVPNESLPSVATSATTPAGATGIVLRINAGSSGAYVDTQGRMWSADTGFNTGVVTTNTNAIAGTLDDVLYQSGRYDRSTPPELRYSFAVPNGTYQVRLHFSENYTGAMTVGARVFDVDIEGARVFDNVDAFAEVGARAALVKTANVAVTDGRLDIDFLRQTENPLVSAIEIIGSDTTPPSVPTGLTASAVSTTQIHLEWTASTDNVGVAGYRIYRNGTAIGTTTTNSYTDNGLSANTRYTYTVSAYDGASPPNQSLPSVAASATTLANTTGTVLRINAGSSSAYVDTQGRTWSADTGFNTGVVTTNANAIAGTEDDVLYRSGRYDRSTLPELRYSFALPNGNYQVRLHFSENYTGAMTVGARVFDVDIEGVRVFNDVDAFAETGARTALIKTANVMVTDGRLDIDFLHQVENPLVNAVEIVSLDSTPDTTPPSMPTGLTAAAVSTSQIHLDWTASTDNVGIAGYRVYRNGTAVGSTTTNSYTDNGLTSNTLYTYTVSAYDGAAPPNESLPSATASATTLASAAGIVLRINAGASSAYVDTQGRTWSADTGFNTGVITTNANAIAGTEDDVLYRSGRYDKSTLPELRYSFAVPNGTYQVRLHFCENYAGTMVVGARVFDVDIEGVRTFENVDAFAEVGARTALIKTANVTVTDGRLDIDFLHQVENPLVNAIEILGN